MLPLNDHAEHEKHERRRQRQRRRRRLFVTLLELKAYSNLLPELTTPRPGQLWPVGLRN